MPQVKAPGSDGPLALRRVITGFRLQMRVFDRSTKGETTMVSLKILLTAAVLLPMTATAPAFAQGSAGAPPPRVAAGSVNNSGDALYNENLRGSGYNPKNDFNPNGTIRAAIQEPGLFAFYYPNLDVLNGGAPTPAARMSRDWPALRGACASIGAGVAYRGDQRGLHGFEPDIFSHNHRRLHHRM
jgi:hypothetical protein